MNTATPSLAEALADADLLHDRAQLEAIIATMGEQIDVALDGERAVFLTVMNGALIFAGELALSIRTDLQFDYVHATRYRGATSGSELHWLREPTGRSERSRGAAGRRYPRRGPHAARRCATIATGVAQRKS